MNRERAYDLISQVSIGIVDVKGLVQNLIQGGVQCCDNLQGVHV